MQEQVKITSGKRKQINRNPRLINQKCFFMNHLRKFDPWCNMQTAKKVFSFPEMIAWRKAKVIQERLQRNKVGYADL